MGFIAGSTNSIFSTLGLPMELYGFFMFVWVIVVNMMANVEFNKILIKKCGNIDLVERD